MGTRLSNGDLVTNGGRVLFVVGCGATVEAAKKSVYEDIKQIQYASKVFRTDIGNKSKRGK
jgi:phosphoribosylamine--glycine ligase